MVSRGDTYKKAFKLIADKTYKGETVLPPESDLGSLWGDLSSEAKTITLYLGFHAASSTQNIVITMLVQSYQAELSLIFNFDYEGFRITEVGRQLLNALVKSQLKPVSPTSIESMKHLQLLGMIKRIQHPVDIKNKNMLITGCATSEVEAHALYQCLNYKDSKQGCFVIQDYQSSNSTLSVNQHAYTNQKQFEYYVDTTTSTRSNFKSLAHDICISGGYYYGSTQKDDTFDGRMQSSQCLLNLLTTIANTVDLLDDDVIAPVLLISLKSIKEIVLHKAIFSQLKRLANSKAQICVCETELAEKNTIYNIFVEEIDVIHVIGRSDINERHDGYLSTIIKTAISNNILKKGDVYVKRKAGLCFGGDVVSLEYKSLYMQIKGRLLVFQIRHYLFQ
ncbi:MAG: hypothetical protein ACI87J_002108 [Colwellia sp.]|jgi:hypothetical protein